MENFRCFDLKVYALADPESAVAEVKAEALIKSTGRIYLQDYVLFLRAAGGKIAFLREYFDAARAASAGHADPWARILMTSGDGPENSQPLVSRSWSAS